MLAVPSLQIAAELADAADAGAPRIAICGGGTAGHVMTGVAIRDAVRELAPGSEVVYVGAHHGDEERLLERIGDRVETVPCAPFAGRTALDRLRALGSVARGVRASRGHLARRGIDVAIGVGGYASVPGVLAAWSLGIPSAIIEVNARPGRANRALARLVDRVYLGHAALHDAFAPAGARVTGVPVRAAVAERSARARRSGSRAIALVLVTGGSLGSAVLNERAPALLGRVARRGVRLTVLHQCGGHAPERVRAAYREHGVEATVVSFIDDFPKVLASADFAIASPGALTLAELALMSVPSLLVPDPTVADDHQAANAAAFSARTGSLVCDPARWHVDELAARVAARLAEPGALGREAVRLRELAAPGAARAVARDLLDLGRRR